MLYELLMVLFVIICLLLVGVVLIQQSKGGGITQLGSSPQMLFGGSGGQDILQKATWTLGAAFMGMSLLLSLMRSSPTLTNRFTSRNAVQQPMLPPVEQD